MPNPKILAFAGSTRSGSINQRLLDVAVEMCQASGAEVTSLKLSDYPLPIFDQDVEAKGSPAGLVELRQQFLDHDALLIASPEYNSSITPLLKNTIDWVSRSTDDLPPLAAYQNKVAGLIAAAPGALGGLRGLVHVRAILQNINVMVVPQQFALSKAFEAFNNDVSLNDEKQNQFLKSVCESLVQTASKLVG